MAAYETDICNQALLRIGERQLLANGTVAADTTSNGKVCAVAYPAARDALLSRLKWRFATKAAWLYEDGKLNAYAVAPTYAVPGFQYVYALPSDCLEPRYIFSGSRPGQPALPLSIGDVSGVTTVSMLPAINGAAPEVAFEVADKLLFTDYYWNDGPPAYALASTYGQGAVVSQDGGSFVSLQANNTGNAPVDGADTAWWKQTNSAQLVYTGKITDVTTFPQLFVEALVWQLAADLGGSIAADPKLVAAAREFAKDAYLKATAAEATARRPDIRPDSRFISVRG